ADDPLAVIAGGARGAGTSPALPGMRQPAPRGGHGVPVQGRVPDRAGPAPGGGGPAAVRGVRGRRVGEAYRRREPRPDAGREGHRGSGPGLRLSTDPAGAVYLAERACLTTCEAVEASSHALGLARAGSVW